MNISKYKIDKPVFGIDVSTWQAGLNWDTAIKEGVKFAILRAGFTGDKDGVSKKVDNQFEIFYKEATKRKLPVGAYWFSRATSYEAGQAEAKYMYENCLKDKQFEYPIAIDIEDPVYQAKASKKKVTEAAKGFCDYLISKNYYPVIYANLNWFRNKMTLSELTKYGKWVAAWMENKPSSPVNYLWQFGGETNVIRSNKVAGKVVDQDYCFVDMPKFIQDNHYNGFKKEKTSAPEPEVPKKEPKILKFKIGDLVTIKGDVYISSTAKKAYGYIGSKDTVITRIAKDGLHPYNTTGDLGWMDEKDIKLRKVPSKPIVETAFKKGDKVKVLKAITYEGKKFIAWYSQYNVLEVDKNRVVIGIGKTVTAAVHKKNLQKI